MSSIPSSLSVYEPRILPALRRIQDQFGYLKPEELRRFSKSSGIPLYRLQEVASFFPHFRLAPAPPLTVKVCRDMACHMAGSANLMNNLASLPGDKVCVEGVSCLGRCDRAPAVMIAMSPGTSPAGTVEEAPGCAQHEEFYCLGRDAAHVKRVVACCLDGTVTAADADCDGGQPYPSADWLIDPYKGGERDYRAVKKIVAARDEAQRRYAEAMRSRTGFASEKP